jgi:hypothetical protein
VFWTTFQNFMKGLGIETKITLKHIVLGYKINDTNYFALNLKKNSCRVFHLQIVLYI